METLIAFFIALLITFFFVRRYVKQLAAAQQPVANAGGAVAVGAPMSLRPCPRCSKSIPKSSTFCPLCGAALSIWNIQDRKSTRLNSSHGYISYAVFCLKKKKKKH